MSNWNHIQRLSVEVLRPLLWAFVVGALCGGAVVALLLLAGCAPEVVSKRTAGDVRVTTWSDGRVTADTIPAGCDTCTRAMAVTP